MNSGAQATTKSFAREAASAVLENKRSIKKTCLRFSSGVLTGAGGFACSSPCEAMLGGARLAVVAGGGFGT